MWGPPEGGGSWPQGQSTLSSHLKRGVANRGSSSLGENFAPRGQLHPWRPLHSASLCLKKAFSRRSHVNTFFRLCCLHAQLYQSPTSPALLPWRQCAQKFVAKKRHKCSKNWTLLCIFFFLLLRMKFLKIWRKVTFPHIHTFISFGFFYPNCQLSPNLVTLLEGNCQHTLASLPASSFNFEYSVFMLMGRQILSCGGQNRNCFLYDIENNTLSIYSTSSFAHPGY
jgi:hypothetical protein